MKNFRHQHQRPKKNTLVIGREKLVRAIEEGQQLDKIWLQSNVHGPVIDTIKKLALDALIPIHKVPAEKLNGFNISNHEGCVGQLSKIQYHDLQQVISHIVDAGIAPLMLILDGITDIRNIGGIARSAFCFGVHAIIIPAKGVGALNEDAILTSAGALEQIPVCRVNNLQEAIETLHLNGISVYATEMKAKAPIADHDLTGPCAVVMGGEEHGVSQSLVKNSDGSFRIPITDSFDSLNVSVAAGIILYEISKQRNAFQ